MEHGVVNQWRGYDRFYRCTESRQKLQRDIIEARQMHRKTLSLNSWCEICYKPLLKSRGSAIWRGIHAQRRRLSCRLLLSFLSLFQISIQDGRHFCTELALRRAITAWKRAIWGLLIRSWQNVRFLLVAYDRRLYHSVSQSVTVRDGRFSKFPQLIRLTAK